MLTNLLINTVAGRHYGAHNANGMGFNWVDISIVAILALAAWQGMRLGLLTQLFGVIAFFGSLFLGGWLYPYIIKFHDPDLRLAANTSAVLITASYAAYRGIAIGQNIHWSFRLGQLKPKHSLEEIEKYLGILPALVGTTLAIWLIGVGIGRLPFEAFSNSFNNSWVIGSLVRVMPPVPVVFDSFNSEIDPNDQPRVTSSLKAYGDFNYSVAETAAAEAHAGGSIVRITSFGCGGIVSGSGFTVDRQLVMTNAHVVAGVKRPIIKHANASYDAKSVYFDPNLDIAVLYVPGLESKPLSFKTSDSLGETVAVLGFPGGNYKASPGILRDTLDIGSPNIYGSGIISRKAYGVQAETDKGGSGGPAVLKDGRVAGMIFSKPTENNGYAYALNASYLQTAMKSINGTGHRVSTGACTVN